MELTVQCSPLRLAVIARRTSALDISFARSETCLHCARSLPEGLPGVGSHIPRSFRPFLMRATCQLGKIARTLERWPSQGEGGVRGWARWSGGVKVFGHQLPVRPCSAPPSPYPTSGQLSRRRTWRPRRPDRQQAGEAPGVSGPTKPMIRRTRNASRHPGRGAHQVVAAPSAARAGHNDFTTQDQAIDLLFILRPVVKALVRIRS